MTINRVSYKKGGGAWNPPLPEIFKLSMVIVVVPSIFAI